MHTNSKLIDFSNNNLSINQNDSALKYSFMFDNICHVILFWLVYSSSRSVQNTENRN